MEQETVGNLEEFNEKTQLLTKQNDMHEDRDMLVNKQKTSRSKS